MAPSRRSARRPTHAHNASASNSKSSHSPQAEDRDSPDPPPPPATTTPAAKGGKGAGKPRRVKEEPNDSLNGDADPPPRTGKRGGKGKAKDKDKEKSPVDEPEPVPDEDDEESGVTRCPCGRIAADSEELGFMIMCEMCKVWQHGLCMGVQEDNVPENYYCEECRPDLHSDIPCLSELKRNKRARHTSAMPPPISAPSGTRSPRSHSPTASTKPKSPKRRNTMNSRDAAYDEDLKRLLALENPEPDIIIEEVVIGGRRKRKRSSAGGEGEPGPASVKRPRSASSASDLPIAAATKEPTPVPPPSANGASAKAKNVSLPKDPPPPPPPPAPARPKKRNGPKKNMEKEQSLDANGDSTGPGGKKHPNQYTYRKQLEMERRRAEKGDAGYQPTAAARRKAAAGEGRGNKADKDSARSPAPQSVSWALPDYLQHLAHILPTETPQPIDVREGDGVEQERGVKVKWPGKRMTIGDMNKRVRNIVEYVAREQAAAEQRRRRVDALVAARAANRAAGLTAASLSRVNDKDKDKDKDSGPVVVDDDAMDVQEDGQPPQPPDDEAALWDAPIGPEERSPTTERLMSDLMTDLIAFQEKFGQGNKNTTSSAGRARREAAVVAADRNGAAAAAAAAAA